MPPAGKGRPGGTSQQIFPGATRKRRGDNLRTSGRGDRPAPARGFRARRAALLLMPRRRGWGEARPGSPLVLEARLLGLGVVDAAALASLALDLALHRDHDPVLALSSHLRL